MKKFFIRIAKWIKSLFVTNPLANKQQNFDTNRSQFITPNHLDKKRIVREWNKEKESRESIYLIQKAQENQQKEEKIREKDFNDYIRFKNLSRNENCISVKNNTLIKVGNKTFLVENYIRYKLSDKFFSSNDIFLVLKVEQNFNISKKDIYKIISRLNKNGIISKYNFCSTSFQKNQLYKFQQSL